MLRLRKSVNSLTVTEKSDLVKAIKALKASGKYDQYVHMHSDAMSRATLMPGENGGANPAFFRNVAHRGPAFGPWHREMLNRFELDLQAAVPGVTLPYWDWAADANLGDPKTAALWGADLMGGDGDPGNSGFVSIGPFRYDAADPNSWRIVVDPGDPGPGLRRTLGQSGDSLPSQSDINLVLGVAPYDKSPWRTVSDPSFRNRLEGFIGPNLHNRVHVWVGGSMLPGTSPNDPVFFLHHCNVDRLWWQWQIERPSESYLPTSGGPPGHNLNDEMTPFGAAATPASTLNIHDLGYTYDTDPPIGAAIILNRNPVGQDEVLARRGKPRNAPGGLPIPDAFRVVVDGFTAAELGLSGPTSTLGPAPAFNPPIAGMTIIPTGNSADRGDYGPEIQRFTLFYQIDFPDALDPEFGFGGATSPTTITVSVKGFDLAAELDLIKQPDPFLLHGDPAWLSIDLRIFIVRPHETWFGVTMGADASAAPEFIQKVMRALTDGGGSAGGQSFDDPTVLSPDEDKSKLYLQPNDAGGTPVFNFALAKVRYIGLIGAADVRGFFRLRQTQVTYAPFDYPPGAQYRRATNPDGQPIPLAGIVGGEYVTVPCFALDRVDSTAVKMDQQQDSRVVGGVVYGNVQQVVARADGSEVDTFFGCWIDVNQPRNRLPISVPPNQDGPFDPGDPNPDFRPLSLKQALARNLHLCLVAEIAFDPTAIPLGKDPSNWDKLAQRNIAWSDVGSAQAVTTFDIRPTAPGLPTNQTPDELMIDWGHAPHGTPAQIYMPGIQTADILALADRMYSSHHLTLVDQHTLGCEARGVSYVPVPPSSAAAFAGVLSLDMPSGLRLGESITVAVRQITNAFAKAPPRIAARREGRAAVRPAPQEFAWRQVLGAFELTIPVRQKALLLPQEERDLSVLRWIGEAIPRTSRWSLVFRRYLEIVAGRVSSFGGHPSHILPSPAGDGGYKQPDPRGHPGEKRFGITGKIAGLIFDRFGDFEGFLLDTKDGDRRFESRERDVEKLAERAWRERLLITVLAERHEPHRPSTIIVRAPPARFDEE